MDQHPAVAVPGKVDEIKCLFEKLPKVLETVVGGLELFVVDAGSKFVHWRFGGHVEDVADAESFKRFEIGGVPHVAEVEVGKDPRGRVVLDVLGVAHVRRRRKVRQPGIVNRLDAAPHQVVFAEVRMGHLEQPQASGQHDRFAAVFEQSVKNDEDGMAGRERLETVGRLVVDDDLLPGSLLEHLLALLGGGQVCQDGLALLQPLPVEPVAAVDVDGAADVVDVVRDERAAVD